MSNRRECQRAVRQRRLPLVATWAWLAEVCVVERAGASWRKMLVLVAKTGVLCIRPLWDSWEPDHGNDNQPQRPGACDVRACTVVEAWCACTVPRNEEGIPHSIRSRGDHHRGRQSTSWRFDMRQTWIESFRRHKRP